MGGFFPGLIAAARTSPFSQAFFGKLPKNFPETAGAAASSMPKVENGPLRAAPINPGQKNTYRKVPSDLGHLAPLWCNEAHKCFAGGFSETSRKLPGQQPAAHQNLRVHNLQFTRKAQKQLGLDLVRLPRCRRPWAMVRPWHIRHMLRQ